MATPTSPTFRYRLITWALFPAAIAYTFFIALKHKNLSYFLQRTTKYQGATSDKNPIWCHCASVGEINTALPVIRFLLSQGEPLLLTTNTVTGYDTLNRAGLTNTQQVFLPLDYTLFARRFLRRFNPRTCLIFETELWPSLLLNAASNNIALAIINGRISQKTLSAPAFMRVNYQRILAHTQQVISSSEDNSARFISLGARPEALTTLDNLKFAALTPSDTPKPHNPLNFPYLLCASTHENEEEQILRAWKNHKDNEHPLGLVIALRHPQRIEQVRKLLEQLGLAYQLHSSQPTALSIDNIYIIDTLGELAPFMAHADIVFMGGSLAPIGGHNMLEPAQFKRCILTGQYYDNFKTIVDELITRDAIEVISHAEQLVTRSHALYSDASVRSQRGINAYQYIASKKTVLERYTTIIQSLLNNQAR